MDDRRFDSLVKTLSSGGSRRGILHTFAATALGLMLGQWIMGEDAEAKKKRKNKRRKRKKRCPEARRCGTRCCQPEQLCVEGLCVAPSQDCQDDDDCASGEVCSGGFCVDAEGDCASDNDCGAFENCLGGKCRCVFPQKPCGDLCCAEDQACLAGQCVLGQGTCAPDADLCLTGDVSTCNGDDRCFCGQRVDGGARCFGGLLTESCSCLNDFDCERDFGAGTICVKGGPECGCNNPPFGICAPLCPTQNGF